MWRFMVPVKWCSTFGLVLFAILGTLTAFATLPSEQPTSVTRFVTVSEEALQTYNASDYAQALEKGQEALELAKKSSDKQAIGVSLSFLGQVYSSLSQYEKALGYYEESLAISREIGDRNAAGETLGHIGSLYWIFARYEKALGYYEEALAIRKEIGDRKGIGTTLINIGLAYSGLGQYEEALGHYEEALAIQKEIGDRNGSGTALTTIGEVYKELGRYGKALGYFEEALAIRKEIGDRKGVGADLGNIGLVYWCLGQYKNALSYLEEALGINKELGDRDALGIILGNIGLVYSDIGQYENALRYYEEALIIKKEIGYLKGVGATLGNIGIVYNDLGQHKKALTYHEEALAVQRKIGDRHGIAVSLGNIGTVYWNLAEDEKALGYFEEALGIHKEIGDRPGIASALGQIGSLCWAQGLYERALAYYEQALAIRKEIGDRNGVGSALANIGLVYSYLGQHEKSYASSNESLKICSDIGAPEFVWRSLRQLGGTSEKLGKNIEAASHYEKALDTIETMRAGLSEKEARISFMGEKVFVYDELIELYQKMHAKDPSRGYDKKALEIFERKQGRVFLEEMGKSGARDFSGLPGTVKDIETDLENRLEKAQAGVAAERSKEADQRDTERLQALEATLQQIGAAYRTLQEQIRAKYPDYYALKYPAPTSLKDIQEKVLGPDEMLLVYGVMKESACLWVIGERRFGFYPIGIGENQLREKVNSWRKGTQSILRAMSTGSSPGEIDESVDAGTKAVRHEGHELYELLIPNDAREALSGAKTLYIVPSGPLYGLPFEALVSRMDGETLGYLVEDYPIAYLSSASLLKTLREAQARKISKARFPLVAFANPVYGRSETPGATRGESEVEGIRERAYLDLMGGAFLELPETEEEAREIKDILLASDSSTPLQLRQDASRSNVLKLNEAQKLADYRYVVFSCHGVVPDVTNRVSQPALVLSQPDPAGGAGFLTMADTFGLRLNADLVTLSACNTGRGIEVRGEGVMGLTRAFMYAGTPAISVTLWSVESMSEKTLSTGLYENLKADMGRAAALREIKLRMIRGKEDQMYRHPFFWAPLVLFGDGR